MTTPRPFAGTPNRCGRAFLGTRHERNEQRTWWVVWLTAAMMIGITMLRLLSAETARSFWKASKMIAVPKVKHPHRDGQASLSETDVIADQSIMYEGTSTISPKQRMLHSLQ